MSEENASEETGEDEAQPVDVSTFTTLEQFDEHLAELAENPTAANLRLRAEAIAARAEMAAALDAVAEAERIAAEAAEENTDESESSDEDENSDEDEGDDPEASADENTDGDADENTEGADPELIAASAAKGLGGADNKPTGKAAAKRRKATVRGVHGQTYGKIGELNGVGDIAALLNKAAKGHGDSMVLEWDLWDREAVGEDNILKATSSAADSDRILGLTDGNGNEITGGVQSPSLMKASAVHRAKCGGCSDCQSVLEVPDCFADYGEPLGATFDSIPADTCKWNVEQQQTLATLSQQVYIYCGTDAAGNPAAGISDGAGGVVPINPADPTTWKSIVDIQTDCGDKTPYSLEEFPLLFRVARNQDMCEPESVSRTINRYLALQARFMENRKYQILRDDALRRGHAFNLPASLADASDDLATFVSIVSSIMAEQAGVDGLEGMRLAVPRGMVSWVESRSQEKGLVARLRDAAGITGVTEVGGTGFSPYADPAYALTPAAKLDVDLDAEKAKLWEFVAYDPSQWRKPVGQTIRIGVTDVFRDMDLAAQNARGIVIYRDETLIPVGCDPSICLDANLCASGVLPGRKSLDC